MSQELNVVVTGAAGRIAYSLIPHLCDGSILGSDVKLRLRLLDVEAMVPRLEGVKMEVQDSTFTLVSDILCTCRAKDAFEGADVCVLLGGFPRLPGMERKDLIGKNVEIIKEHALAIDQFAKKTVKVLVVANPANTNAWVASTVATSIPPQNFTCLTRLDEERLRGFIVSKANSTRACTVNASDVVDVCIFGNHSATQVPSIESGTIDFGLQKSPISELFDSSWLNGELVSSVQQRGAAVMNAQGASSAMSAAASIAKHLRDWIGPNHQKGFFSMGVRSDGVAYGVQTGLWFSFPCKRLDEPGKYEIFNGVPLSAPSLEKILITTSELVSERTVAETFLV